MWKNWNRTGRIKAIALILLMLPNLLRPMPLDLKMETVAIIAPFLFGCIAIPLIARFNAAIGKEIRRPAWNDNPLTLKYPLSFFHFGAAFFISIGISMFLGTLIRYFSFNIFGLVSILYGAGMLVGIHISLRWMLKK